MLRNSEEVSTESSDSRKAEYAQLFDRNPKAVNRFREQRGLPPTLLFFAKLATFYQIAILVIWGLLACFLPLSGMAQAVQLSEGRTFGIVCITTAWFKWYKKPWKPKPKWLTVCAAIWVTVFFARLSASFVNGVIDSSDARNLTFVLSFLVLSTHAYLGVLWFYAWTHRPLSDEYWKLHDMVMLSIAFFAFVGTILYSQVVLLSAIGQLLAVVAFSMQLGKLTVEYFVARGTRTELAARKA